MSEASYFLEPGTTIGALVKSLGMHQVLVPGRVKCGRCRHSHYLRIVGGSSIPSWQSSFAWYRCYCGCTAHVHPVDLVDAAPPPPAACCERTDHHHHVVYSPGIEGSPHDYDCTLCRYGSPGSFSIAPK